MFKQVLVSLLLISTESAAAATAQSRTGGIIIDHRSAAAAGSIPHQWLDRARNLNVYFGHQSVGNNILMSVLNLSQQQPERWRVRIAHNGSPEWLSSNHGIVDFPLGQNGDPQGKIQDFQAHIESASTSKIDVAMMKFCFADVRPQTDVQALFSEYRGTMESLQSAHPNTTFVWCTCPLVANQNNSRREEFNTLVRDYCRQHDAVLFDIADIECHDGQGRLTQNQFGTCLDPEYSQDGGHPNSPSGMRQLAAAWWSLMSSIAGWHS